MLFAYTCAGSRSIVVKESCHRQDGLTKIKIPRGSAACEGRSIVCFVCVVHLFPGGEEGALFLYNVLMVGSITYVHRLPNMALKPLAANVPPRRMKGYF